MNCPLVSGGKEHQTTQYNYLLMKQGKVKWYNETKGFGFIETKDGKDIFVHRSGLLSAFGGLAPEQEVEFDIKQGDRGLVAINVK